MSKLHSKSISYIWKNAESTSAHRYLLPRLEKLIADLPISKKKYFDAGFGNGFIANHMYKLGWDPVGVDLSEAGYYQVKSQYPHLKQLYNDSLYENLASRYGKFNLVLSVEVIEHLYDPRLFLNQLYNLLNTNGYLILSTPYHGYLKNLAIAIAGGFDRHFTALWDHGHIKFWSKKTLFTILKDAGFNKIEFYVAGRFYPFSKSMILVARK
jgi:2-polyprenyl-6-hydroxyphenyl methylase/3-demethylubiquinone-9 3-methyltransferase